MVTSPALSLSLTNGHMYLPSEHWRPHIPRLCVRACVRAGPCVLTHDRDVVLDQEQGFLAALHQHGQSVGVPLSVQRHPVYAHHSVSSLQRALSGGGQKRRTERGKRQKKKGKSETLGERRKMLAQAFRQQSQ